jgi:hypothetical protein
VKLHRVSRVKTPLINDRSSNELSLVDSSGLSSLLAVVAELELDSVIPPPDITKRKKKKDF